jgi:hypothetical protein
MGTLNIARGISNFEIVDDADEVWGYPVLRFVIDGVEVVGSPTPLRDALLG